MILISACLLGHRVRYDGGTNAHALLMKYHERGQFLAVCPECFAMLPIPRPPMELQRTSGEKVLAGKGHALDKNGQDTTEYLITGAEKVLKIAEAYHVRVAILKERSPSCGTHFVHTGKFDGKTMKGMGVCAALLEAHGIKVYSDEEMTVGRLESLLSEDKLRDRD